MHDTNHLYLREKRNNKYSSGCDNIHVGGMCVVQTARRIGGVSVYIGSIELNCRPTNKFDQCIYIQYIHLRNYHIHAATCKQTKCVLNGFTHTK